ncbi:hypothetical protein AX16_009683 [Volvariella volvacea WC 439]|nr:hypothetical protein AX16_009683 [Volvariella volvacea WC 439]
MVGLLSLPTELLLHIIYTLRCSSEPDGLLDFARVCRRLNSIYISSTITTTQTLELVLTKISTSNPQNHDDLSTFIIAFDIHCVGQLTCRFQWRGDLMIYDCWRLYLAISRLDTLHALQLELPLHEPLMGYASDTLLRRWVNIFGGLLNEALRKGCKRLVVRRGQGIAGAYRFVGFLTQSNLDKALFGTRAFLGRKPALDVRPHGYWARTGSQILASLKSKPPPSLQSPIASKSSLIELGPRCCHLSSIHLSSIEVSSHILLRPPFSQWVYEVFQASPHLTSLAVSYLTMQGTKEYDIMISTVSKWISQPLTSLTLQQLFPPMPSSAMNDFFSRIDVSKLTRLVVDDSLPYLHALTEKGIGPGWPIYFPSVQSFQGPPDYLSEDVFKFSSSLNEVWIVPRFQSRSASFGYFDSVPIMERPLQVLREQHNCSVIGLAISCSPSEFNTTTNGFPDTPSEFPREFSSYKALGRQISSMKSGYKGITDLVLCSFEGYERRLSMLFDGTDDVRGIEGDKALYLVTWLCGFIDLRRVEFRDQKLEDRLVANADDFASLLKEKQQILERLKISDRTYEWNSS